MKIQIVDIRWIGKKKVNRPMIGQLVSGATLGDGSTDRKTKRERERERGGGKTDNFLHICF